MKKFFSILASIFFLCSNFARDTHRHSFTD